MPIDSSRLDDSEQLPVRPGTNKETVLSFLAANPREAYSPSEVAEATGVNRNSVGTVLSRLATEGLVRHRDGYWAVAETDAVAVFVEELRELGEAAYDLASDEVDALLRRIRG